MLRIERATDMSLVRELLEEYGRSTHVDLSFQNFDHELRTLPHEYDPILVAWLDDALAGCVALRRIDGETCEMKRLYVRPAFRGRALGRTLADAIIAEARQRGFARMRLDTLPSMREAMSLYESLGFVDIDAYRFNPIAGSRYMELDLHRA
ncbi:MAG TPA: GNAT family N-acetyltransferase [Thermoanaerobaculia bacterium]